MSGVQVVCLPYVHQTANRHNREFLQAFFHSSQNQTCKLAARIFIQSQYLKALAASFCNDWKRGLRLLSIAVVLPVRAEQTCFNFCHRRSPTSPARAKRLQWKIASTIRCTKIMNQIWSLIAVCSNSSCTDDLSIGRR